MAKTRKFLIKNFKVLVFFLGFLILSAGVVYAFTGPGTQSPGSGSGAITVSGDNVGIGTTSPGSLLHIVGNSGSDIAGSQRLKINLAPGGDHDGSYPLSAPLVVLTENSSGGNTPSAREYVTAWSKTGVSSEAFNSSAFWALSRWENSGTDSRTRLDLLLTSDSHSPTDAMTWRAQDGIVNVGIGNTSPSYKLDVSGTGRFTQPVIVATPTSDTHAATKSYVDSSITGGNADTVDGLHGSQFIRSDTSDNVSGHTEWQDNYEIRLGSSADTRIHHNGSHTYIQSYKHGQNIYFQGEDAGGINRALVYMRPDSDVDIYPRLHANSTALFDSTVNFPGSGIWNSSGNVGIGDTTPSYKLDVTGDIYANGGWLRASGSKGLYFQSYGGGWYMTDTTWIRSYNNKQLYVDNEIRSSTKMQAPIFYDHNNTSYYANPAGQSRMNQAYLNYLGVGTSVNTSYSIYVPGNTAYGIYAFGTTMGGRFEDSNSSARVYAGYGSYDIYANGTGLIQATGSMRAPIFYDSDNTSYYINPSSSGTSATFNGRVAIGTATFFDDTNEGYLENVADVSSLEVRGSPCCDNGAVNAAAILINTGNRGVHQVMSHGSSHGRFKISVGRTNGDNYPVAGVLLDGGESSWSSFSDRNLKTDLEIINNATNKLKQIHGYTFNWIDEKYGSNDRRSIGLIAQEVEKVLPEAVTYSEEGYTLKYTEMIPLLVNAINEQQLMIEELEERIEKMENGNGTD